MHNYLLMSDFELNWSPEVIWYLIVAIAFLFCTIVIYRKYKLVKNKSLLYFFSSIVITMLFYLFSSLSFLILRLDFYRLSLYLGVLMVLFFLLFIESTSRETISPLVIGFMCVLISTVVFLSFTPGSFQLAEQFGYPSIKTIGVLSIVGNFSLLVYAISPIFWSLRIFINSPKGLKKMSLILFVGTLLFIIAFVVWSVQSVIQIPGAVFTSIGTFVLTFSIISEPRILNIVPFKTSRLIVIHRKSGLPLFNYNWTDEELNWEILSGLLFAVEKCSIELLKKGDIRYLILEQGILVFKRSERTIVGLLTQKASKSLQYSIEQFAVEFEERFEHLLSTKINETNQFNSASELIDKFFIPTVSREVAMGD